MYDKLVEITLKISHNTAGNSCLQEHGLTCLLHYSLMLRHARAHTHIRHVGLGEGGTH